MKRSALFLVGLTATSLLASCTTIEPVPPAESVGGWYTKQVFANGIPVQSSQAVDDKALHASRIMVEAMLSKRPDLTQELLNRNYSIAIMAEEEALLDLPEFTHWTKPRPDDQRLTRCERLHYEERIGRLSHREYWNRRVRGIAGQRTVVAEEDVLGRRSSRYFGETILVHEVAHGILTAIRTADPSLLAEVEAAYSNAKAQGLWANEYGSTTLHEYWAEGTQFWFNSNFMVVIEGRQILNHDDLQSYDPRLFDALAKVYSADHRVRRDPFYRHSARTRVTTVDGNSAEQC